VNDGLGYAPDMKEAVVLDQKALRASADHNPRIERQMVLLFMVIAERCLVRIQGLVVRGDSREWQAVVHDLKAASAHIHATELATLCKHILGIKDDAVSRMGAYTQIREAYEGLVISLRNAGLLTRATQGE